MAEPIEEDLFVCTEDPVEVDDETHAAILRSRKASAEGRLHSMQEVRSRVAEWITRSSSQSRP